MMKVLIDGDSSFVLDLVVVYSRLMDFEVVVYSNSEATTRHIDYTFKLCEPGPDMADKEILKEMKTGDVIITDDNLLAYLAMQKGGKLLSNAGVAYNLKHFIMVDGAPKNTKRNKPPKAIINKYLDFMAAFFALTNHKPQPLNRTIHIFRLGWNKDQGIIRKRAIAIAGYFGYGFKLYTRAERLAKANPDYATLMTTMENQNMGLIDTFKRGDIVITSQDKFAWAAKKIGAKAIDHEGYVYGTGPRPKKTDELHEGRFMEGLLKLMPKTKSIDIP